MAPEPVDGVLYGSTPARWKGVEGSFDSERATESPNFYPFEAVPSAHEHIPLAYSDIRYVSNLSEAQPLWAEEMLETSEPFAACTLVASSLHRMCAAPAY